MDNEGHVSRFESLDAQVEESPDYFPLHSSPINQRDVEIMSSSDSSESNDSNLQLETEEPEINDG